MKEIEPRRLRQRLVEFEPYLLRTRGRQPLVQPSPLETIDLLQRSESKRIVANWVVQVACLPAYRAIPELALSVLQGEMQNLLDETLHAIVCGDPWRDQQCLQEASKLAVSHGGARGLSGIAIDVVLTEFHLVHREVWSGLWRLIDAEPVRLNSVRLLQPRLDAAFDILAAAAAEAWVRQVTPEFSGAA